jgi:hypothetical protein
MEKEEKEIVHQIVDLVASSLRKMPAHYTSYGERKQTFLVDFKDIAAADEYEMASQAWYSQPDVVPAIERVACVKIAEDIMIGCYILKKSGQESLINYFVPEIMNSNIYRYPKDMHESLIKIVNKNVVQDYFEFCKNFGLETAG